MKKSETRKPKDLTIDEQLEVLAEIAVSHVIKELISEGKIENGDRNIKIKGVPSVDYGIQS